MKSTSRRLAGVAFLLVAFGVLALSLRPILTFEAPQPDRVDEDEQNADVFFEVSPSYIWLPGSCFRVSWQLENIDAVWLHGKGRGGNESAVVCGGPADFLVRFQNGSTQDYELYPAVVISQPEGMLLALAIAITIAWQGLYLLRIVPLAPQPAFQRFLTVLFLPQPRPGAPRIVTWLLLLGLFLIGVQHWVAFYNWGNLDLDTQDWRLTRAYWDTVSRAIDNREIPYFTADNIAHTERFIGDPDPAWNPLLAFADRVTPAEFALINTLLFYSIGFVGLLALRRRYRLATVTFTLLFLLYNFNGFITSHMAIGHFTWVGYFFYPYLILFLLEMIERDDRASLRAGLKTGLTLALMALFGSFHMVIWWGWTLLIFGVFATRRFPAVLVAVASAGLLSAFRYLPVAFAMSDFDLGFRTGFPTLQYLLDGLTSARTMDYTYQLESAIDLRGLSGLKWWEFDMFISIVGFMFVVIFGLLLRFVPVRGLKHLTYGELDMPMALMAAFSMSNFYQIIFDMPLPFFNSERVTSRFFVVPLLLLIVVGCLRFQHLLPLLTRTVRSRVLTLILLWQAASALGLHSMLWEIVRIEARFRETYTPIPDDAIRAWQPDALSQGEWLYVLSLPVGIVVTLIAVGVWVVLYRRWRPVAQPA
jgi:hypothetical protein